MNWFPHWSPSLRYSFDSTNCRSWLFKESQAMGRERETVNYKKTSTRSSHGLRNTNYISTQAKVKGCALAWEITADQHAPWAVVSCSQPRKKGTYKFSIFWFTHSQLVSLPLAQINAIYCRYWVGLPCPGSHAVRSQPFERLFLWFSSVKSVAHG
jgi:hypothetical protein